MRELRALDGDVEELDGRGRCAVPGLVDCHTHAAFAGDRVDEFALRAGGRDVRGAACGRRRHPRDRARDARGGRGRPRGRGRAPPRLRCCAQARRRSRRSRATGSIARRSSRRCARSATPAASRPGSGAHAVPPEFADADAYLDFALDEVLPEAAQLAEAADVFLERGAFDAEQARRYLEACRAAGLALRLHGDQFTEAGAIPLAVELGARSVDHLEATGRDGIRSARRERRRRRPAARERALPRPADAAGARARRLPALRSRSRRTSIPAAHSARACRSSARSPARSSG